MLLDEFAVVPGLHTQDEDYTFDNPTGRAYFPMRRRFFRRPLLASR